MKKDAFALNLEYLSASHKPRIDNVISQIEAHAAKEAINRFINEVKETIRREKASQN